MSEEKRQTKRYAADLKLNVSTLFKQDYVKIEHKDAPIEVTNVSRGGIGFKSDSVFPIGYYFNAALRLGEKEDILYCVIKIIRADKADSEGMYLYGAQFVGMSSVLDYIFDEFEENAKEYM